MRCQEDAVPNRGPLRSQVPSNTEDTNSDCMQGLRVSLAFTRWRKCKLKYVEARELQCLLAYF
jgi:hypothetical protein